MAKYAFVVPRYAASIGGGAETLMRSLAIALKDKDTIVDILATCAKDHRTWDNFYSEGIKIEDGLNVIRFKVDERNIEKFLMCEQKLASGLLLSNDEQIIWFKNSVNSSALYQYLVDNKDKYDLIFFAPYLFGTTFWGAMLVKEKAILVPCLHDESYAYLPIMRTLFRSVRGIMWNAQPESELAKRIYNIDDLDNKSAVVGMGFEDNICNFENDRKRNYFLYSGRKETGKGLDILIKYYSDYRSDNPNCPKLVLIGSGQIDFLNEIPEGIEDLGFVTEEEKLELMHNALCLFQPSINESFSIVLMEAWRQGTAVLVNSDCAVTNYHVQQSGGGLTYRSYDSFSDCLNKFIREPDFVNKCGENGMSFVRTKYSWESVLSRFNKATSLWLN